MHYFTRKITVLIAISVFIASLIAIAVLLLGYKKIAITNEQETSVNTILEEDIPLADQPAVRVFHASEPEKGLVVFISDTANKHISDNYARQFANLSYYVARINSDYVLQHKTQTDCVAVAESLLAIISAVQDHFHLDKSELPILVGEDEGALAVYAALAQAEKHSFHAGISINFSAMTKTQYPLCNLQQPLTKEMLSSLTAVAHLPASWYIFQDATNPFNEATQQFTDAIGNAKLTIARTNNETPLTEAIQILQWLDPRLADQISSDNSDSDLPIIEVPLDTSPENTAPPQPTNTLAVLITGDGGWAEIDKNIAQLLAEKGIPTVALDSLSYFWKARTPEQTAADVEQIIDQYTAKWQKTRIILIGYSFGADVMPFIANNLAEDTQKKLALVALLGVGKTAAFEFRLASWVNADKDPNRKPILPELDRMRWAHSLCIYGVDDQDTNCPATAALGVKVISMPGDHHFDKKYEALVQHILNNIKPE